VCAELLLRRERHEVLERGGGLIVRREVVREGNPEQKKNRLLTLARWKRV
jgi:hypothetical protein